MEENKIYDNDIEMLIDQFKIENDIDDIKTMHPNIWNAVLIYVCNNTFKRDKSLLKDKNGYYNAERVNELCDLYIYLCFKYSKIPSITGFSFLSGIETSTIYEWNPDSNSTWRAGEGEKILSDAHYNVFKKLANNREEGLQNNLISGKINPVGTLAVLNHFYDWNMPGVRDNKKEVVLISRNEIENALENNRSTAAIEPPKL